MNVTIQGHEHNFISGYPDGWVQSDDGYFKGPVTIGGHQCFVKRFNEGAHVTGWKLMEGLKGRSEHNLTPVYDIVEATEGDQHVYYVFYAFLEGEALDKLVSRNVEVKLKNLYVDLLQAFQSLHQRNYWLAGFSEKNVFCEKSGKFLLVGLEHARTVEEFPDNGKAANEDYWLRVVKFYREAVERKPGASGVNGASLNYLQVIFLMLRLKFYYWNNETEYTSPDPGRQVPAYLNDASTLLAIQQHDITEIKRLINEKVFNTLRVVIRETRFYYISDYPNDTWKKISGDYFKVVKIDRHTCFVKRFEAKTPERIPGWQLMNDLKGKNEQSLSRIFDISGTRENGRNVYYVFYEFIEGETLDKVIAQGVQIDLEKLAEDLFNGIQSLQAKGYWFADFIEKNIFLDKKRGFVFIDLDSAQPASVAPGTDMDVSMEYWIIVLNFYTQIPPQRRLIPSDLYGITLNYLQVIFLILRLKIHQSNKTHDYHKLYDHLPAYLNKVSFEFKELFDHVFQLHQKPPEPADVSRIKDLVRDRIFSLTDEMIDDLVNGREINPTVRAFTLDHYREKTGDDEYVVESGKAFRLSWEVDKATAVALYKNGEAPVDVASTGSVELTETLHDGHERNIVYTISASNDIRNPVKSSLTVMVSRPVEKQPPVVQVPVIRSFTADRYLKKTGGAAYSVLHGETFVLRWEVENADRVELKKNGEVIHTFNEGEKSVELSEPLPEAEQKSVQYSLVASNDQASLSSGSLTVTVTEPEPPAILSFTAANYSRMSGSKYVVRDGRPFTLKWEVENASQLELFTPDGRTLKLDNTSRSVKLREETGGSEERELIYTLVASNNTPAKPGAQVVIIVKKAKPVPVLRILLAFLIVAVAGGIAYYLWNRKPGLPDQPPVVSVFPFKKDLIAENDTITIFGKNLPLDEEPVITFGSVKGSIVNQTPDSFHVRVPKVLSDLVAIAVSVNDSLYLVADNVPYGRQKVASSRDLPPSLNEIWHNQANNRFIFIDVSGKIVYFTSGGRGRYETARIRQVKYDSSAGIFTLVTEGKQDLSFYVRNLKEQSFELSASNNSAANWNDFNQMLLYYDKDPSKVYLPVTGTAAITLEPSQQAKFNRVLRSTGDSFAVSLFHTNALIQAPDIEQLKTTLAGNAGKPAITWKNIRQDVDDPFRRNYLSIARLGKATASTGPSSKDSVDVTRRPAGINLGYLQFDSRNNPDETSKKHMNRIAKQLSKNPQSKITFYATWYYSNNYEEAIILTNIFSLKNYLTSIGIPGNSKQIDTKISASRNNEKYLKRIQVIGLGFPDDFLSSAKISEDEDDPYKPPQTSIDIMKKMIVTLSSTNDNNWKVYLENGSSVNLDKVTVEITYRLKYDGETKKELLNFENSSAGSKLAVEAPFLYGAAPVSYLIKSIVRSEY